MHPFKKIMFINLTGISLLFAGINVAIADDDDFEGYEHEYGESASSYRSKPVRSGMGTNDFYQKECGSCHFAFHPRFLPARSWTKIMGTLDSHFGENADLDAATNKQILNYLVANAGQDRRFSRQYGENEIPMRITELYSFRREHREIPNRMVKDNLAVRSFANCQKCHTGADRGNYGERGINIPGFGRWED